MQTIELELDTKKLVESFARDHNMAPEDAAFYLAAMGGTTSRFGGYDDFGNLIFCGKEVVPPQEDLVALGPEVCRG